jgi:enoyl-CoA hydratase/carnithine racemase
MAAAPKWTQVDVDGELDGLIYEKSAEGIAVITLNRPERGNALSPEMRAQVRAIWEDVRASAEVRAVIVTGAGDRHFCTGADMVRTAEDGKLAAENGPLDEQVFWTARQNRVWKPVIAAVNGTVAGAGLHFVVDADVVVARKGVQFLDTHVNVGIVGALENIGLAKRLPLGTALRMSLQGKDYRLTAERAYTLGMVDELAEDANEMEIAHDIARSIIANSPQAVSLTQQAIWRSLEMGYDDALHFAWSLYRIQWSHPDYVEGPRAFSEGRPPMWDPDPDARI